MPKLDLAAIEQINRTGYPPPYDAPMAKRHAAMSRSCVERS